MNSSTQQILPKQKNGLKKAQKISPKSSGSSVIVNKNWTTNQIQRNVFEVRAPVIKNKDWEFWCLLSGDRHWDNPHSNHKLQIKHLDQALERKAVILDGGDSLCLMQGKYDRRASKSDVRPEHQVDNYLDAVISTAADFFLPYAHNFVMFATGNHEAAIIKNHETHPIDRMVSQMNIKSGSNIHNGGYSGWVFFRFDVENRDGKLNGSTRTVKLHYDHGFGGGGPVTHDAIQHQRRAVYLPDADIIVTHHTHDAWTKEFSRARVTERGSTYQDIQYHIKCPGYKEEYHDGYAGWHVTTGKPPKPIGAYWLRFFYERSEDAVQLEVIRAQ